MINEQAEAIARLREWLVEGQTVYTILCKRSASGMTTTIRLIVISSKGDVSQPTYIVAKAIGMTPHDDGGHWTIRVKGCNFNTGGAVVGELARTLYGSEKALTQAWL